MMAGQASITFTQPGVQPPVYVVTSLSSPPWETLELAVSDEKTASGDLIFTRQFGNIAEGSYQYKIRLGDGYWVVDESKDSAVDGSGNCNNVVTVKPVDEAPKDPKDVSDIPTPFVVVDKVADKDQPEYGHVKPGTLNQDAAKRTADAEPDFETVQPETLKDTQLQDAGTPPVPIVVVEKTDDSLAHGDDFGKDATNAQKAAHELRATDASPDKIIVTPEPMPEIKPIDSPLEADSVQAYTPDTEESDDQLEEQTAPLLPHEATATNSESDDAGAVDADPIPTIDSIEGESARSSTDQESSRAGPNTPSEFSENREEGEAVMDGSIGELDNGPLLSHETEFSDDESLDELDNGPLLSHETGFAIHAVGDNNSIDEDSDSERASFLDEYGSEAPLLPHERHSSVPSVEDSDADEPTFPYETARARTIFSTRTNTGGLPNKLPRSDEEDDDLHDPSLERFPTNREQILERVASIGNMLPADETREPPHSPAMSTSSQACSSIDLRPATSYSSLKPVVESLIESDSDSESENAAHAEGALFRKVFETGQASRNDAQKPLDFTETALGLAISETESVQKNDGANDGVKDWGKVYDSIATPANLLDPLTPPLSPDRKASNATDDVTETESMSKGCQDLGQGSGKSGTEVSRAAKSTKENWLQSFVRFLTVCFRGRKQASGTALAVGVVAAAYYYYINGYKR